MEYTFPVVCLMVLLTLRRTKKYISTQQLATTMMILKWPTSQRLWRIKNCFQVMTNASSFTQRLNNDGVTVGQMQ